MLRLKLFGTPAVVSSGKAVSRLVPWRKPLAVLALLAAADEGLSRDKLHAFLWPEATHGKAAHALNQLLHVLRRDLGGEMLLQGSSDLRLNPERITSDLAEFREAQTRGDLERAVALYAGPLLDGFFLHGTPEFERWLESERARLGRAHNESLGSLAAEAAARGDHQRAAKWWRRLAEQAPLSSGVTLQLMAALAAAGDRAGALKQAELYRALVREELEAAPSDGVMALAAKLRGVEDARVGRPVVEPVSLAVAPFLSLSVLRRDKLFVDGLTAEVINALCHLEGIQLLAATADEADDAAREGGSGGTGGHAQLTLQGTLRPEPETEQVRLTVQLIDASTRRYLWSGQYRQRVRSMVPAQEQLARRIVADVRATISRLRLGER
jgi:DNA-binding SARP family transcriptional activator